MQYLPISEHIFDDILNICPGGGNCNDAASFADIFSTEMSQNIGGFSEQRSYQDDLSGGYGDPYADMRERASLERERMERTFSSQGSALPREMEDVQLSEEDFSALEEGLVDMGLSDEDIADLREQVKSAEGLTMGGLIQEAGKKLDGDAKGIELSDAERRDLLGFFQKLGFAPQKSEELIQKLEAGDRKSVIKDITQALSAMGDGESLTFGSSEINSLIKGLGFPEKMSEELRALFAGKDSKTFANDELKMLSAFLKKGSAESDLQELQDSLRNKKEVVSTLKEALEKALPQTEEDKGQGGRILKLLSDAEKQLEQLENKLGADKGKEGEGKAADLLAHMKAKEGDGAKDSKTGPEGADDNPFAKSDLKKNEGGQDAGLNQRNAHKSGDAHEGKQGDAEADADDNGWNEFWSKVRRDEASTARNVEAMNIKADHAGSVASAAEARAEAVMKAGEAVLSKNVMKQVQNGILQKTADGSHKLMLQLRPEHLGNLHLALTVKNKDVTAVIRAENDEAAGMINEQLAALKQQLEEQGLKVSKLEVRTQLSEERADMQQSGTDLHNEARERERFARLREQMRAMREEAEEVVREMQSSEQRERSAHTGVLNVVA
jgi:flagellar hook-length control protein FliK